MTEQSKKSREGLALYVRDHCMFCNRVVQAALYLRVDLELRNIWQSEEDERILLHARGRATVPVLKIERVGEEPIWMGESIDIVRYLERTYGNTG